MRHEKKLTPDQLLSHFEAEEENATRGRLKVFLGYASGVGKSYRMLDEGRRRRERGQDVIVGATQPRNSPELAVLLQKLEILPLRLIAGIPVVDVDAILRRRPEVCLIDGLAHDNPPEARNAHRWQDVEALLSSGISVISTINLEFVAERQEQVEAIREKKAIASVPEAFLRKAEEVVVVDAPASSDANGSAGIGGSVSLSDKEKKLSQLREIALLLAADVVDGQLEAYLARQGIVSSWGTQERILVCLTPKTDAARMMERARLANQRFHGALFAIHVRTGRLDKQSEASLERNLQFARDVKAEVVLLDSDDEVDAIIDFAHKERITQLYIGHSTVQTWRDRLTSAVSARLLQGPGAVSDRLIKAAEGMDVKLFRH